MGMSSFVAAVVAGERMVSGSSGMRVGKARPGIATTKYTGDVVWPSGSAGACDLAR